MIETEYFMISKDEWDEPIVLRKDTQEDVTDYFRNHFK